MRPDVILFDWDNTLVDGWAAIQAGLNAAFRAFDMPEWDRETVLANVRRSLRESFPEMFGAEWEKARDIFYAAVRATHLQVLEPMPGVPDMLASLPSIPVGVVSNKQGPLLRAEADHLGWRFDALVGAGDATADKPDAAPLLMALAQMGAMPGPGAWYVGDTALDMEAARAAGCVPVLLGMAEHDGGVQICAPVLHFPSAAALATHVRALDKVAGTPDIRGAG
ncbi:HAD family hydrolase [Sabulicella rubraurantiaca]|uniref:HAD family hydrolase n=1 Tax=Sabulicella rubraurantiaca TaxID=2811429 RepID=UPI002E2D5DBF|nr:HAD family hydrolase [Sabulicella rubraurantiaca]